MSRRRFVVAIHEIDRCYGGPEEGGWYYDAHAPSTAPEHRRPTRGPALWPMSTTSQ